MAWVRHAQNSYQKELKKNNILLLKQFCWTCNNCFCPRLNPSFHSLQPSNIHPFQHSITQSWTLNPYPVSLVSQPHTLIPTSPHLLFPIQKPRPNSPSPHPRAQILNPSLSVVIHSQPSPQMFRQAALNISQFGSWTQIFLMGGSFKRETETVSNYMWKAHFWSFTHKWLYLTNCMTKSGRGLWC